jgi:hypothetical protein
LLRLNPVSSRFLFLFCFFLSFFLSYTLPLYDKFSVTVLEVPVLQIEYFYSLFFEAQKYNEMYFFSSIYLSMLHEVLFWTYFGALLCNSENPFLILNSPFLHVLIYSTHFFNHTHKVQKACFKLCLLGMMRISMMLVITSSGIRC